MPAGDLLSDPSEQRRLLESIYAIERAITKLSSVTGRGLDDAGKKIKAIGDDAGKAADKAVDALDTVADKTEELLDLQLDGTTKSFTAFEAMVKAMQDKVSSLATNGQRTVAGQLIFGDQGPGAISGQFGGISRTWQSMQSAMFSGLPAAGMLGLLLNGFNKKEEWKVKGEQVVQMFDGIERSTRDSAARIGNEMRDINVAFQTSEQAIAATAGALRNVGIAGSMMGREVKSSLGGLTGTVYETLTHIDEEFKLAQGAAGAMAGSLVTAGYDIEHATRMTQNYAEAARGAGIDTQALFGTITQLAMGMKLQRTDIKGATDMLAAYRDTAKEAFGLNDQAANAQSLDATGRMGAGVMNMDEGRLAYFGNILAAKNGRESGGLAGLYGMMTGFRDKGHQGADQGVDVLGGVISEAITRAQGAFKGDDANSLGSRMKMIHGMMGGAASMQDAALLANLKIGANGQLDKSGLPAGKESLIDELQKKQVAMQTPTNVLLDKIQEVIARLGEALLITLVRGFDSIVTVVLGTAMWAKGETGPDGRKIELSDVSAQVDKKVGMISDAWKQMGTSMSALGGAAGRMGSAVGGGFGFHAYTQEEGAEAEAERDADIRRNQQESTLQRNDRHRREARASNTRFQVDTTDVQTVQMYPGGPTIGIRMQLFVPPGEPVLPAE